MIEKKLTGGSTVYWYNNTINLSSLMPQADGTVSGDVMAYGGYCFAGAWLSPVTSPADGVEPTVLHVPVTSFCAQVDAKISAGEKSVLKAISAVLEDVYKEQLPK